ncbi:hypothetical protein VCRA2113O324_70169 [Vibrio crassostreae]|nr:hypothetical protein VCRA2113O324_70169 [Vibrio crassostreae]CAK3098328.1 hypothetical protein VCRA2121O336_70079 [Vibrio crassostreae]CAK3582081.1 hypothetical protein VCRA2120O329_60079 [Vibrio crassostreae]CAK3623400.1 hypothetical protein VCRA217O315_50242 [Vibrio crassostreae]CAK4013450.1 hypothetical protein VCRA2128O347_70079 [Vibrio crassostreae]
MLTNDIAVKGVPQNATQVSFLRFIDLVLYIKTLFIGPYRIKIVDMFSFANIPIHRFLSIVNEYRYCGY